VLRTRKGCCTSRTTSGRTYGDGAGRMVRYRAAEAPANVQDGHPWTLLGNRLERGERLTDPSDYFAAAGPPQPVVVAGRAGWRVELTPPARKSYPLVLVVDAAGGALLRAGGGRGGDEWVVEMTRFETDVPVDEATFRWTGPYTDAATVSEERAARRRRATPRDEEERARVRERLEILTLIAAAIDRRREVADAIAGAPDLEHAKIALGSLLGVDPADTNPVLDLQLRRLCPGEADRIRTEIADLRTALRSG
jgi:hypothetical protein